MSLRNVEDDFEIELFGEGLFSKVREYFKPRLNDYNNKSKDMLNIYGGNKIIKLTIYRTPLHNILTKALNVISLGKFSSLQKKYGFDKFYHLGIVATLDNNKNIMIQKLEDVDIDTSYKTNKDTEVLEVPIYNKDITLNDFVENTRKAVGDYTFFSYDPFVNNCQWFIKYLLNSNGLLTNEADKFLFQNIEELTKQMPAYARKISRVITDTAATVSKIRGKGEKIDNFIELEY